ncbi:MAG: Bax inhibitor-1/YccA family protein, partial [Synergistaceae bacterium]|nr:Bax inhibitor-1/YccA family protein [Synergistaceae bacterium]
IASAFFITAGTFGAMSVYGYTTKRDLSGWGSFLMMGLIGVIIASVVNIWMRNEMMMWVISYITVFVFVGLTAYDTQKLKNIARNLGKDENLRSNIAIVGALTLYLDFINLFITILRITGKRR